MFLRLKKILLLLDRPRLIGILLRYRVLAGLEHKPIFKIPFRTVVDVGANRGQFSLTAYEYSSANIYAFEPQPKAAKLLQRIFLNDARIKIFTSAIGNRSEKKIMHVSARDDCSSLLEITEYQNELFPGTYEIETIFIDVSRLNEYISSEDIVAPAILKIDVQGFEMEVIEGSSELLNHFNYIYCESSFVELYRGQKIISDIIKQLNNKDFELVGLYNPYFDANGGCIQADFLFHRK